MSTESNNDDRLREQIVAYLDGELPADECEAIESRLATDESLRNQVQGLDRAWNALDHLPRATVGDGFARSTIEMAAVEAKRDVAAQTAAMPAARRRRGYALAGACVGAMVLGFGLVRTVATAPDRQLLSRLPVIYQLEALEEAGGAALLRSLPADAVASLAADRRTEVDRELGAWITIADADRTERAAWVAALPADEKAKLRDAAERYRIDLSPDRRKRIDDAYAEVAAAPDRDQLLKTALEYTVLDASYRAQLSGYNADERSAKLVQAARDSRRDAGPGLSDSDAEALRGAIRSLAGSPFIEQRLAEAERRLKKAPQLPQNSPGERLRQGFLATVERQREFPVGVVLLLMGIVEGSPPGDDDDTNRGRQQRRARAEWEKIEPVLVGSLTGPVRERINRAQARQRVRQLRQLVQQATRQASESLDLEEYFASDSLDEEDRWRLLAMPSEEMREALRQLYRERELGGINREQMPFWDRWGGGAIRGQRQAFDRARLAPAAARRIDVAPRGGRGGDPGRRRGGRPPFGEPPPGPPPPPPE